MNAICVNSTSEEQKHVFFPTVAVIITLRSHFTKMSAGQTYSMTLKRIKIHWSSQDANNQTSSYTPIPSCPFVMALTTFELYTNSDKRNKSVKMECGRY